jgi:hypothetical protein
MPRPPLAELRDSRQRIGPCYWLLYDESWHEAMPCRAVPDHLVSSRDIRFNRGVHTVNDHNAFQQTGILQPGCQLPELFRCELPTV